MARMTIAKDENTFIEDLNMLEDWFLQYEYLLQISCEMPKIPSEEKRDDNKVPGCQSGVWLKLSYKDGKVMVLADSDALIIRGIISIIVSLLNNRTPQEIIEYEPRFISETNIARQISTDRFKGLHAVVNSIQEYAKKCL
ncbi:SufE family protein [Eubacterium oxidoreducens]|uniref:Cysteine desulfuration protein SufE n=1 Tax=Eubacterium oxidoreducens TaxID=1732 RepID=A0A1G6C1W9_EUBOX|nr:SufE family protein [Eubacterium oxidoreducens]SDB26845.1 cysteine desulfuration protein SufE [Eubacterium oxidoreducens]